MSSNSSQTKSTVELKLNISPELNADLEQWARTLGLSKEQTTLKCFALMGVAMAACLNDRQIGVYDPVQEKFEPITGI